MGSVRNPGRAATEAEEQNKNKFKVLADDGYLFQPLVFCVQVAASTGKIVEQASYNLSVSTEEIMAGNFFKQRMSYSIQNGKEKCVLNTIIDKAIFGKIFFISLT